MKIYGRPLFYHTLFSVVNPEQRVAEKPCMDTTLNPPVQEVCGDWLH